MTPISWTITIIYIAIVLYFFLKTRLVDSFDEAVFVFIISSLGLALIAILLGIIDTKSTGIFKKD